MAKVDVLIRRAKRKNPGRLYILTKIENGLWRLECKSPGGMSERLYTDDAQALASVPDKARVIVLDV